jgi:hypothetical protein
MDPLLKCLERLGRRQEVRFWIKSPNMSSGEARLFLELTKKHFLLLVRSGIVPYHWPGRKARYFNKEELNLWLVQICFHPESEIEKETAEHFIKIGRVRLWTILSAWSWN